MARLRDDEAAERPRRRGVPRERLDQCRRGPVEILVAAAHDDRERHTHLPERGPATVGPVVWEDVLRLARPVQREVAPRAVEAERARDERVRTAPRDALGHRHAPA